MKNKKMLIAKLLVANIRSNKKNRRLYEFLFAYRLEVGTDYPRTDIINIMILKSQ